MPRSNSGRPPQPVQNNRRYSDFWARRRKQFYIGAVMTAFLLVAVLGIVYLIHHGVSEKVTYSGDALLQVFPKSERDVTFLQKFDNLHIDANVWGLPIHPDVPVFMYVKAGAMHRLEKALKARNLTFSVIVEDWQKLIDREEKAIEIRKAQHSAPGEFDLGNYHQYEEIVEWLEDVAEENPLVNITSMGKSYEGRELLIVTISTDNIYNSQHGTSIADYDEQEIDEHHHSTSMESGLRFTKPVIYINCGVHAREWVAISSCIWLINQLQAVNNSQSSALLETFDFWIVPLANPDGYVYTWTKDRMWRKNRSPNQNCFGVDLNRNFDVSFNGTSRDSCTSGYGGSHPESEAETKAMVDLLTLNRNRTEAALFIHSFSQLILSPYSTNSSLPLDFPEMERVMNITTKAMKSKYGTSYRYGSTANTLYTAHGSSMDYCYDKLGITYSFVFELRDTGTNAFLLPIDQIIPTAIELWDGIVALASGIKEKLHTHEGQQQV